MNIINKSFKINIDNIKSVLDGIFPNLNYKDKIIIIDYTTQIIKYIACRFCFDLEEEEIYYKQFNKNNFRDIKSVINLLLPYIDDVNGTYVLHQQVTTLSDIAKPNITNINYDRSLNDDEIYRFSEIDLYINYKLILDTLNVSSNKLYINWLNCLPYTLTKYKESLLWKQSYYFDINKNKFNFIDKDIKDLRCDFDYYGIHIYDIYNCCNQFLFQHMLPIKWLLYEKLLYDNKKPVMYIEEICELFNLELLLNKKYWELLSEDEKTNISSKWYGLLSSANKATKESKLNKFHLGIVKNIILHYESFYNSYEIFSKKIYEEEEEDKKEKKESNDYTVIIKDNKQIEANDFIKLVDANYKIDKIYNFLILTINEFNKTWFGKKIIIDNKINYLDIKLNIQGNYYLTYKNIYNFAKYICYENYKYITEARCLSNEDLENFIKKLNETTVFRNVIILTYKDVYLDIDKNIPIILENISLEIRKILMSIVFESHIIYGLLSNFKPVKEVTDNQYKSNLTKNIQTIIFNDENITNFKDTYYFLTNDKYNKLDCYDNKKNKIINYIDCLKEDEKMHWFTPFALDWIYQMQFNHRFLNNRLIYVTGATGQGKSTQIPKLLYYATKAFCLVMNPKVISTQPRIKPTKDNAKRISVEMGVPIEVKEGVNTFLDYIQYNTKDDKHKYNNNTYIRELIDKILYDEILDNPLLEDKYNVIIIDEAHEHNKNMDLILTLMKSTLYFNNKIRFIITSATIDLDEPKYRKYYRNIDDNLLFPCNRNFIDNKLDRIVIDRRTHISPPGETTRFKVSEEWETKDPNNYKDAEKIGIKRAIEIAEKNNGQGDILFFSIGKTEIKNICIILNEKLPPHAIALPFYSSLSEKWKRIATSPEERVNKLNFDKTKLINKINEEEDDKDDKDDKEGDEDDNGKDDKDGKDNKDEVKTNYTTVIIVATNIAEASITISNLKFVIDTGYVKSMRFDIKTNKTESQTPQKITNMNRLQRKGRVGRIGDGAIYYTYTKTFLNDQDKNPNYDIINSDFTINLFKFLTSKEEYISTSKEINQEELILKTDLIYKDITDFEKFKEYIHKNYLYFFKNSYTYDNKNLFNPKGIEEIRNYDVLKVPRRYTDGKFSIKDIEDEEKEFYLIHPNNIELYYKNCKKYNYILTTSDYEVKDIKNKYFQDIFDITINFSEIFGQEESDSIPIINTLIHSIKYNCLNECIKIICWLIIITQDNNLRSKPIFKICNKYKKIKIKSKFSDLLVLQELEKMFSFDHDVKIEDLTPPKDKLKLYIDWLNNTDNNKWFNIVSIEEYKKYYDFIFNKNTELGKLQFNKKINYTNDIINEEYIKKYIEIYKEITFLFDDNLFDNKLLENHLLIKGYKKIKEIAEQTDYLEINRTSNITYNILRSFFSGYSHNILICDKKIWKQEKTIYQPHNNHFLENINGTYFAIQYININNSGVFQPKILSKVLDINWINEKKSK
jgi:hypothetical protein